jgi:hypothetical protein
MGFVAGPLKRLIQGRVGSFQNYRIAGDMYVDVKGSRLWLIQFVQGKTYSVVDGEIRETSIRDWSKIDDTEDIVFAPGSATLKDAMKQAISEAISQWEKEIGPLPSETLQKGYLRHVKSREHPENSIVDYWFTTNVQHAHNWGFENNARSFLPRFGVDLPLKNGGKFHIDDFEVENPEADVFLICCHAPFDLAADTLGKQGVAQANPKDEIKSAEGL